MRELEGKITANEDDPVLKKLERALTTNGLKTDKIEEVPRIGFENPETGYAIWVGGILEDFEKEYNEILDRIPRGLYYEETLFIPGGYYTLSKERRDILARRIMLKKAIDSLETKIEEQRESSEGSNYIVDTYYRIHYEGRNIGLFIKYPNGSSFPDGF